MVLAATLAACSGPPQLVGDLELVANPSGKAPLTGLLRFTTDRPAQVTLKVDDGTVPWEVTPSSEYVLQHDVPVLGMRPGRANTIEVGLVDETGRSSVAGSVVFDAPPLPERFPPFEVRLSRPGQMEPGVTLVTFFRWAGNQPDPDSDYGLAVGLDAQGEVIWYYETDKTMDEALPLANGNLLHQSDLTGLLFEIDMLGRPVRRWHSVGIPKPDIPPESIPVEGESFHHDHLEMPSGNFLVLTTEIRRRPWPKGPMPGTSMEERDVVGDVLIEMVPDTGEVVRRFKFFDLLDPERRGYQSFMTTFYDDAYEEVLDKPPVDWTHMNSIHYLADEDAVISSSPAMHAIFKTDLARGELRWILGMPDGWREPWSELRLKPEEDFPWFGGQHAAEITPRGTLLLFDNYRPAFPPQRPPSDSENYSRVVEYEINEEAGTVRQVWSYGDGEGERFFSPFISEADMLQETGNVLICAGGQMNDKNGEPTFNFGAAHHWVTLLEVTRDEPAEKVWEVVIDDPRGGWASYRAERVKSLYPALR